MRTSNETPCFFFAEDAIRSLLRWDAPIDEMETALTDFSAGRSVPPVRSILTVEPKLLRYLGVMPAVLGSVMGVKSVSFYSKNAGTPMPTRLAIILQFRTDTGEPIATLDGRLLRKCEPRPFQRRSALADRWASPSWTTWAQQIQAAKGPVTSKAALSRI